MSFGSLNSLDLLELPAVEEELSWNNDLQPLLPHFFVARMGDAPQNPIIKTLKERQASELRQLNVDPAITPLKPLSELKDDNVDNHMLKEADLWTAALETRARTTSSILSWDNLSSLKTSRALSGGGFLSEQDHYVFSAAQYHFTPRLYDENTETIYVTQSYLLENLRTVVLGLSSHLHHWDPETQHFVTTHKFKEKQTNLVVDGQDSSISRSLIAPFIHLGTLLRRLELLVVDLRTRPKQEPTMSAFCHSISASLSYVRSNVSRCCRTLGKDSPTSLLHLELLPYGDILEAIASLCGRDYSTPTADFTAFEYTPTELLSLIYEHLGRHIEQSSRSRTTGSLAFLLTETSKEYIQDVARSVGYSGLDIRSQPSGPALVSSADPYTMRALADEERENSELSSLDLGKPPRFFSKELAKMLPAAQKSLILLKKAQPDHPLFNDTIERRAIQWLWTERDLYRLLNEAYIPNHPDESSRVPSTLHPSPDDISAQFKVFDLDPGSQLYQSLFDNRFTSFPESSLQSFLATFPENLPPITPTLDHLASLIFQDLLDYSSQLSGALLSLLLTPSRTLDIRANLELLRSYLLISSSTFKSKLSNALFSDAGDYDLIDPAASSRDRFSLQNLRSPSSAPLSNTGRVSWAVGISQALLDSGEWPPVGAELNYVLRRVIVDSLENRHFNVDLDQARQDVVEEAESRLGFAIRDLPTGRGKERWLNPSSIEALDFLYMDYKPPHPINVVITPDILTQYQRVFIFLLRLVRVEHAIHAVFRMTRLSYDPLFPTLVETNRLLLHFRFVAQSFFSSISGYVFDTAIGSNFDAFLARLRNNTPGQGFSDVFSLGDAHAALLNDILSACLIRSNQRAVGDVLKDCLETVLDFANLIGERRRGSLEEHQVAHRLEELYSRFRRKMAVFVKALERIDKGRSSGLLYGGGVEDGKPAGGTEALGRLFLRLDMRSWWGDALRT